MIDKLPFDAPGDPLIEARIERINKNGGKAFSTTRCRARRSR
ncbi:MAG: hypothetical protein M5R36_28025 [Deltaproteobacteria bacterium]|nr:hypothetical protein [Deltaproteobacteria bacterium]